MRLPRHKKTSRVGFTLIELLVVIAIIALLVSLTSAAVFKILGKIDDVKNVHDISDLATGVSNFQSKFKVAFVPSRIHLLNDPTTYILTLDPMTGQPLNKLDYDSNQYIRMVWPKIQWSAASPIIWNSASADTILEGDQCLVFFLGGVQESSGGTNACIGFSTSPTNPMLATGDRIQPFMDFKSNRLSPRNNYFTYIDAYGKQPFAYFSSYKTANGYNRYYDAINLPFSDCTTLGVWPYVDIAPTASISVHYLNGDSFQIISAGRDTSFGPGFDPTAASPATWTPATADKISKAGRDDMCNFYDLTLGSKAN